MHQNALFWSEKNQEFSNNNNNICDFNFLRRFRSMPGGTVRGTCRPAQRRPIGRICTALDGEGPALPCLSWVIYLYCTHRYIVIGE